jgi:hypothetical protein
VDRRWLYHLTGSHRGRGGLIFPHPRRSGEDHGFQYDAHRGNGHRGEPELLHRGERWREVQVPPLRRQKDRPSRSRSSTGTSSRSVARKDTSDCGAGTRGRRSVSGFRSCSQRTLLMDRRLRVRPFPEKEKTRASGKECYQLSSEHTEPSLLKSMRGRRSRQGRAAERRNPVIPGLSGTTAPGFAERTVHPCSD